MINKMSVTCGIVSCSRLASARQGGKQNFPCISNDFHHLSPVLLLFYMFLSFLVIQNNIPTKLRILKESMGSSFSGFHSTAMIGRVFELKNMLQSRNKKSLITQQQPELQINYWEEQRSVSSLQCKKDESTKIQTDS